MLRHQKVGNVNFREKAGLSEKKILEIPYATSVQLLKESQEADNIKWVKVKLEGWVAESYLSDTEQETIKRVNSSEGYLNFRENAGLSEKKILEIPHDSSVQILQEFKEVDNIRWVKIEIEGWVAETYLSDIEPETSYSSSKNFSGGEAFFAGVEYTPPVAVASDGTLIPSGIPGIDTVSTTNKKTFKNLMTSKIPDTMSVRTDKGVIEYKTSKFSSQEELPQFSMIKLGASGYGAQTKGLSLIKATKGTKLRQQIEDQIKVCEELGIPYGFYHYSTSISTEEAEKEAEYILNIIKELKEDEIIKKYFLLGVCVDREVHGGTYDENDKVYPGEFLYGKQEDRQIVHGGDGNREKRVEDITEATAYVLNSILKSGETDIASVYIGERCFHEGGAEQLVDMESLYDQLEESNKNNVYIWLVSHILNNNDNYSNSLKKHLDYLQNIGFNVPIIQSVLDAGSVVMDLNIANPDFIRDRVRGKTSVQNTTSLKIANEEGNQLVSDSATEITSESAFIGLGEDVEYIIETIKKYEESETEYGLTYCFKGKESYEALGDVDNLKKIIHIINEEPNLKLAHLKLGISINFEIPSSRYYFE